MRVLYTRYIQQARRDTTGRDVHGEFGLVVDGVVSKINYTPTFGLGLGIRTFYSSFKDFAQVNALKTLRDSMATRLHV